MSHFVTIKSQIKDMAAVSAACSELGLTLRIAPQGTKLQARGYNGQTKDADAVIVCPGPYDVALNREADGTYGMTTDWYQGHVEKAVGKQFQRVVQLYGIHRATAVARAKGLSVRRQAGQNGAINLVMTGSAL